MGSSGACTPRTCQLENMAGGNQKERDRAAEEGEGSGAGEDERHLQGVGGVHQGTDAGGLPDRRGQCEGQREPVERKGWTVRIVLILVGQSQKCDSNLLSWNRSSSFRTA